MAERGPMRTADLISALRGRLAEQPLRKTLEFLLAERTITRESARAPWRLLP